MKKPLPPAAQDALRAARFLEQKEKSRRPEKSDIEIAKAGLHQIINRSNDGVLGTSKVADMRNIALRTLQEIET
jgi:hypothetical protein